MSSEGHILTDNVALTVTLTERQHDLIMRSLDMMAHVSRVVGEDPDDPETDLALCGVTQAKLRGDGGCHVIEDGARCGEPVLIGAVCYDHAVMGDHGEPVCPLTGERGQAADV